MNPETGELLENQLTEQHCQEQLQRIKDAGTFVVMHNGKFDYEVIKCTCDIEIEPSWDTMIAAQMIDENEPKSLKEQYKLHVDSTHDKYDIEHLFKGLKYEIVPIDLFALYAGADPGMTLKLYQVPMLLLMLYHS